jgi:hypothetical protein
MVLRKFNIQILRYHVSTSWCNTKVIQQSTESCKLQLWLNKYADTVCQYVTLSTNSCRKSFCHLSVQNHDSVSFFVCCTTFAHHLLTFLLFLIWYHCHHCCL